MPHRIASRVNAPSMDAGDWRCPLGLERYPQLVGWSWLWPEVIASGMSLARSMVWPTSPGAVACAGVMLMLCQVRWWPVIGRA